MASQVPAHGGFRHRKDYFITTNKVFAEQLLEIRSCCQKLKEVKGLPQVHQVTLFEVIAEVEQEKLNQPKQ